MRRNDAPQGTYVDRLPVGSSPRRPWRPCCTWFGTPVVRGAVSRLTRAETVGESRVVPAPARVLSRRARQRLRFFGSDRAGPAPATGAGTELGRGAVTDD